MKLMGKLLAASMVLLACLLVWRWQEPAQFARMADRVKQQIAPPLQAVTSVTSSTGTARKCKRGTEMLYTNDKCPAGSQEEAVKGGLLSVLPAAPVVAAPAQTASEPSLMEKRIDKVIGN
jgi:hypothetical protein